MKLTCLLITLTLVQVSAETYSQTQKFTLNLKDAPLAVLFEEIEKTSEFNFFYDSSGLDLSQKVTVTVENSNIETVLDMLFTDSDISYEIFDRYIILKSKERENIRDRFFAQQQQGSVSGKVTDSNGLPLPGVTVVVKGTTQGTVTNADGEYSLSNLPEDATLVFSFVGMRTQEIVVGDQTSIDVTMEVDAIGIEEVVAVGYGTIKKSDLTGSVSNVRFEAIENIPTTNVNRALQGKAPGVFISQNDGSPGGEATVRIRGYGSLQSSNDPLFVVDGIPISGGIDQIVNPSDIASVEILKDASAAAIYGSRGANGVVLITTKKGKVGEPQISFSTYFGVRNPIKEPDLLNAREWAQLRYDAFNDANDLASLQPEFKGGANGPSQEFLDLIGEGTDWWDVISRQGKVQNYNLSLSGGSKAFTYISSINYFNDVGWIDQTDYQKLSFRLNTTYKVSDKINIGNNLSITNDSRNTVPYNVLETQSYIAAAMQSDPITPIFKTEEEFQQDVANGFTSASNHWSRYAESIYTNRRNVAGRMAREGLGDNSQFRIFGNIFGEFEIIDDLTFRTDFSINLRRRYQDDFVPRYYIGPTDEEPEGIVSAQGQYNNDWVWNNIVTYSKTFDKHDVTMMAGMTSEERVYYDLGGEKRNVPANDEPLRYLSSATTGDFIQGIGRESALVSYLGRVNYSFNNKYLLTASIRTDGSSNFAEGNKWGTFPSFSLGWRLSEEGFFNGIDPDLIGSLKIRGGWGQLGNQAIPPNSYITLLTGGPDDQYPFGTNESLEQGYRPLNAGNKDIKWETHEQTNIGLDIIMLKSSLSFTADYYIKTIKDMILTQPLPFYSSGVHKPLVNFGTMKNSGLEFIIDYRNSQGEFKYEIGGNISFNRNEVVELAGGEPLTGDIPKVGTATLTDEGEEVAKFWGYDQVGVFQTDAQVAEYNQRARDLAIQKDPTLSQSELDAIYYQSAGTRAGDFIFADIDGDGRVTDDDKDYIGSPHPDFTYGFNLNFEYMNFTLNAFFQGVYGNDVFFADKYYSWALDGQLNYTKEAYESAWTGEGSTNEMFRVTKDLSNNNLRVSDWYLEDGSYLRLRNLELGYNIPASVLSTINLSSLKVYVAAENLFTLTNDFPGLDPETGENHGVLQLGVQQYIYPVARTFMAGLKVNF